MVPAIDALDNCGSAKRFKCHLHVSDGVDNAAVMLIGHVKQICLVCCGLGALQLLLATGASYNI